MTKLQLTAVLLVEDDDQTREMFRSALNMEGFSVFVAADGISALRQIELRTPDLVLLDLGLPLMSGAAILDELQSSETTRHVPVVIVTGTTLDLHHKVAATLKKPVDPYALVAEVRRVLRRKPKT